MSDVHYITHKYMCKCYVEKFIKLVNVGMPLHLFNPPWWWNEDVKQAVTRKKDAHKAMHQDNTEENKRRHNSMKNKAKKAVVLIGCLDQ